MSSNHPLYFFNETAFVPTNCINRAVVALQNPSASPLLNPLFTHFLFCLLVVAAFAI
jgi:hypothetical protein